MADPFVESPHVAKTGGRQIDLIVIHTAFQEWGDLEPDGIVGPLTWGALQRTEVTMPFGARALEPV